MTAQASPVPGWTLALLLGVGIGQSPRALDTITSLLEAFQNFVNALLIPVYSFCVVVYIFSLIFKRKQKRKVVPLLPPPIAVLPTVPGVVNMTGSFQLVSSDNFDGLLAVQGVPWALRRAADQARPTHRFIHNGDAITIQIRGIIESETTYQIGGPHVETAIRGRVFHDSMTYLKSADGIKTTKKCVSDDADYNIEIERRFTTPDKQRITMTSTVLFNDPSKEDVVCVQQFERID